MKTRLTFLLLKWAGLLFTACPFIANAALFLALATTVMEAYLLPTQRTFIRFTDSTSTARFIWTFGMGQ